MIYYIGPTGFFNLEENNIKTCSIEFCLDYFKDAKSIAVDTETKGRNPHTKRILSLQLGDAENQFVIDCRVTDILIFKNLLESKKLLLHNAKFDYKFLKHAGIVIEDIWDTMLAECVLNVGRLEVGYGLDVVCERYTKVKLDKSTRGEFFKLEGEPFNVDQILYAAKDVAYLHSIASQQYIKLQKFGLLYAINLENNALKALGDMEYNGIILDKEKWINNIIYYTELKEKTEGELDNIILNSEYKDLFPKNIQLDAFEPSKRIYNINYSSPIQVKKLLTTLLKTDIINTNDKTLEKIKNKHPIIEILQSYREYNKIITTYGWNFLDSIHPSTQRVHTDFWQILVTYRLSSGNKKNNQPNMQNIPKSNKFRNCFVASPGYKWVSIDYQAQELRLMADFSNEDGFIDVLNKGEDLHCFAGSMMFKKPVTKEDKDLRNKAKTINFGKPYGMGVSKLSDTLQIPLEEAEQLFKEYAQAFPKLNAWLESQARLGKKQGFIRLPKPHCGIRWFPNWKEAILLKQEEEQDWRRIKTIEGEIERFSMNSPIQGGGAVICKEALVETRKLLKHYDGKLLLQVHDELNFEVREDQVDSFIREASEIMTKVGNKYVNKVSMAVETTVGDFWTK